VAARTVGISLLSAPVAAGRSRLLLRRWTKEVQKSAPKCLVQTTDSEPLKTVVIGGSSPRELRSRNDVQDNSDMPLKKIYSPGVDLAELGYHYLLGFDRSQISRLLGTFGKINYYDV
jgi:hypothetical protein